jgi:hypothetical protein
MGAWVSGANHSTSVMVEGRMKNSVFAACLLAAVSSFAGVTYDFHSETVGLQQAVVDGTVAVDGPNVRMSMVHGDGIVFKDGTTLLSRDGGKTLAVYDASAKTFFEIGLDDLTASAAGMLKNLPVKVDFSNPVVKVQKAEAGRRVEGYPAEKSVVDATIDINIDMSGRKMTSKMSMHSENWTTGALGTVGGNIFQQRNVRTGIDALDKLIEAQSSSLEGRFPLKQMTTVHLIQNGHDISTTTTTSVTNIKQKALDASTFAAPAGYRRVDGPWKLGR